MIMMAMMITTTLMIMTTIMVMMMCESTQKCFFDFTANRKRFPDVVEKKLR